MAGEEYATPPVSNSQRRVPDVIGGDFGLGFSGAFFSFRWFLRSLLHLFLPAPHQRHHRNHQENPFHAGQPTPPATPHQPEFPSDIEWTSRFTQLLAGGNPP